MSGVAEVVDEGETFRARSQADREDDPRDLAIAVLSHDLRNLIFSMALNLELIASGWEEPRTNRRHVDAARRVVNHMAALVTGILDHARAHELELDRRPCRASALVGEVVEMLALDARRAGVRLSSEIVDDAVVCCDAPRIVQVLSNVIGNALKFTPPGGAVAVAVRASGGLACFTIADTGPGIPPDDLQRIFERSYRAGAQEKPGHGLGLWIARRIALAHGGRIWAESAPGAGAAFFLTLPCE